MAIELAGSRGDVGCQESPKTVSRLQIDKPGVYENFRIDAQGGGGNIVKITADDVTLRNCEVFNGRGNGVGVFGTRVLIENCRIHHLLNGMYTDQKDAHGITGRWGDVTIRNCEISHTSGDSIQFDPDRRSSGRVIVEKCTLMTGPLARDSLGFKEGERPGENAIDTKTPFNNTRCQLVVRECFMCGWNQPAQIENMAALNIKENVDAEILNCVFFDNEIALRARGPGKRGGSNVIIRDCAIYQTSIGIRAEDSIERLIVSNLAFDPDVTTRIKFVNGGPTSGYMQSGEREAPEMETLLRK